MLGQVGPLQPGGLAPGRWSGMSMLKRRWLPSLGFLLGPVLLVAAFNRGGLWDPHELHVAELARGLATQLFGSTPASWEPGAAATVTAQKIGQGELGVTSPALGFAIFGVSDWAGRITSLFWGTLALASLWHVLGRFVGRTAQVIALLVLASTPLFAWQSRTLLGDAPSIGTTTLTIAALLVVVLDWSPRTPRKWRVLYLGMAIVGMAAGVLSRGVLVGIGVPNLAVGIAALLCGIADAPGRRRLGLLLIGVGAVAAVHGVRELLYAKSGYSLWLGVTLKDFARTSSFDLSFGHFLHQTFPLSAFLPWAIAAALDGSGARQSQPQERLVAIAFTLCVALSLITSNLLALRAVFIPFPSIAAMAGMVGILGHRSTQHRRTAVMGTIAAVVVSVLLFADFINLPEKTLLTTGVHGESLAESLRTEGRVWYRLSLACVCAGCLLALLAATNPLVRNRGAVERYRLPLDRVRAAFGGQLLSGFVLVETALGTLALLQRAHEEAWISVPIFNAVHTVAGPALKWLWMVPPLLLFVLPAAYVTLQLVAERVSSARWCSPGLVAVGGLVLSGLSLTLGLAPSLAERLSPKRVAMQYRTRAKTGEGLALLGMKPESVRYYVGFTPGTFTDVGEAAKWLQMANHGRRWLSFGEELLAQTNAAFRADSGANLVLLEPPHSSVLLATNRLEATETNLNPLARDLLGEVPALLHRSDVEFGGMVRLVGWEVRSLDNAPVTRLRRGVAYELRLVFSVQGTTPSDWQVFVHLDGRGRRHNSDHEPVLGHYPTSLWQPGDVIVDRHRLVLERTSLPGTYTLHMGLFRGSRRLEVTGGGHTENRVTLGSLQVDA